MNLATDLLGLLGRTLVSLRYRVTLRGLDEIRLRGTRGILFLPNHPALIDPVIVRTYLQPGFAPKVLADEAQLRHPAVRWVATRMGALTIKDPAREARAARSDIERGLRACALALNQGENVLLYPAGRVYRSRLEDLGANSAVETLRALCPGVRIVLLRSTGLWGSSFSWASGFAPDLARGLVHAVPRLLANGILFSPRRRVTIEAQEPRDLPSPAEGRNRLNRALEAFYNAEAPRERYVPFLFWERGGPRDMAELGAARTGADLEDVASDIREQVIAFLEGHTGRSPIAPKQNLARDLGLDSLGRLEVQAWVEQTFGRSAGDLEAVETVADVVAAAAGQTPTALAALNPIPRGWFSPLPKACAPALPAGDSIPEVFLAQAARAPGRVAVADQTSGARTYRDIVTGLFVLKPRIERLPGDHVGILLPASVGATVAYLAALFAGKVPVMLNWTVGERGLSHAVDLMGIRAILTSERLVARLDQQGLRLDAIRGRFVPLERWSATVGAGEKLWAAARAWSTWRGLLPRRTPPTAAVLFTSGSESLPKAVPLSHGNILANVRDVVAILPLHAHDKLLGMLPPFHSFGLTGTLALPLTIGLPVVYHPNPTEGGMLARLVEAYRVSLLVGTPTFLQGIARAASDEQLATLRLVITGAEKCPESLYATLERRWPSLVVMEGYGITECSPVVSANRPASAKRGTIGPPLPSVDVAIRHLDGDGRVTPGETGMLLVRGPSIFAGYFGHAGPSPFEEFEGQLWYRTGDLVRQGEDGALVFAGRLKRFVKLGGEMVSLPAVEETLLTRFSRADDEGPCLAVEATASELQPELVLFATRAVTKEQANVALRDAGLSPLHAIRRVRLVDALPVLGSGKTDYQALQKLLLF